MNKELVIAIIAGLGAMLGWGFADFFAKKTIEKIGDVTTLFWGQLVGIIPLCLLFLINPVRPEGRPHDMVFVILLGIFSGLTYIPTYIAFGKGKVSLLSPIFAAYAVVVAILSAVFFREVLSGMQWAAVGIVLAGILLASTDPRDLFRQIKGRSREKVEGLPEILTAVFSYSIWLIALDRFVNGRDWVMFLLIIRIFSSCALFLFAKATKRPLKFSDRPMWKYIVGIGLFDVAAFSFLSYGYSATPHTTIVTVLAASFSVPTLILAWLFLKERISKSHAIAVGIILLGIVVISLS